ncbi:uncharacterized protein [Triticum aestivum]|uniref:uncharacterized protein n=1 Tax=Triticum aestivum TaxID=4565 RepID=UPI001D02B631|nr:uncharacterized protein LOC123187604 [Triticum aestivum]XP_044455449.1 uncharacterized protein LOC123187604 [Triticum aestivum]
MQMMHIPRVADPPTANSVLRFLWLHRDGWLRPAPVMASIHPMNRTTWEMYDDLANPRLVSRSRCTFWLGQMKYSDTFPYEPVAANEGSPSDAWCGEGAVLLSCKQPKCCLILPSKMEVVNINVATPDAYTRPLCVVSDVIWNSGIFMAECLSLCLNSFVFDVL